MGMTHQKFKTTDLSGPV